MFKTSIVVVPDFKQGDRPSTLKAAEKKFMAAAELLTETNPNGNCTAVVADDGRVVYLYVHGTPGSGFELKTVWVRNRVAASRSLKDELAFMEKGKAPQMPAAYCRHPKGEAALDPNLLRVVWLPEGNGVALFQKKEMLAAIVPWSGQKGFCGYARDALGEGPNAWELSADNNLHRRFAEAEKYWAMWDSKPSPWETVQASQLAAYEAVFGKYTRYFAIDGGAWPPKALAEFEAAPGRVLATIGVGLRPQPEIEMYTETPELFRRIEIGMVLRKEMSKEEQQSWRSYISAQAGFPWVKYTWLGHGHTIGCEGVKQSGWNAVLLVDAKQIQPYCRMPDFYGDPVTLLWMVPISAQELAVAQKEGSKAILHRLTNPR